MTTKEYNVAVDSYADNLYRFALKHLKNEMLAKDVVQDTFEKVWVKHEDIDGQKVKSYLFTTAYHAIVDSAKKESKSGDWEKVSNDYGSTSQAPIDLQELLHEALDRLPEVQKSVVLLRDYEGYNYGEIAEITNLSESQVKVYIFRARVALKDYIKRLDLVI